MPFKVREALEAQPLGRVIVGRTFSLVSCVFESFVKVGSRLIMGDSFPCQGCLVSFVSTYSTRPPRD